MRQRKFIKIVLPSHIDLQGANMETPKKKAKEVLKWFCLDT